MDKLENLHCFSAIEIEAACKLAQSIDPSNSQKTVKLSQQVKHVEFKPETPLPPLLGRKFYECSFLQVPFIGIDAHSVLLKNCALNQCQIANSNFKFSNFSESKLCLSGLASSFDFSDFSGAAFLNSHFEGCSFSESYFYQSQFLNSKFVHSEFAACSFFQSHFENLDFACSNLDYTEFEKCSITHVTFPYWDILHVTKGLSDLLSGYDVWFSTPSGSHRVQRNQYTEELLLLRPFFYHQNDYLALSNLYIVEGEHKKAYDSISSGIKYACQNGRFNLLRHLCRIASVNSFFSRTQMRTLYQIIEEVLSNAILSPMEYKNYLRELDLAKRLLIDCPFDQDSINITVQTSIPHTDYQKLSSAIKVIDTLISTVAPTTVNHIEMRHNSPLEIMVQVSGAMSHLILFFAILDFLFDKSSTYIERVQDIILKHRKIAQRDREQTDMELLEKQITRLSEQIKGLEHSSPYSGSPLILPGSEDFQCISYTLYTRNSIPEELRTYSVSRMEQKLEH